MAATQYYILYVHINAFHKMCWTFFLHTCIVYYLLHNQKYAHNKIKLVKIIV
jgi:hypothetical protein